MLIVGRKVGNKLIVEGELMLGRSPRFQALLNRSRQSIKEGKGLSEGAFWKAVRKRAQQRKAPATKCRRTRHDG